MSANREESALRRAILSKTFHSSGAIHGVAKREFGILLLLAAIWGASFLFIRIAAPVLGPTPMVEVRVLLAGACLLLVAMVRRQRLQAVVPWPRYLLLGFLNAAAPFTLIGMAELTLSSGTASILNATTPLFTALGAAILLGEGLTARKGLGLVLGIGGVALLVGFRSHGAAHLGAVLLSLAAAVFYALGGIYAKLGFPGVPPRTMATYQQFGAAAVILPFAVYLHPNAAPTAAAVWSVLVLAIVATAFGYILYYRLLTESGPTKTLSVTFLVPVFAVIWGHIFLGERITAGAIGGLLVILLSVLLVTGLRFGQATREPAPASIGTR